MITYLEWLGIGCVTISAIMTVCLVIAAAITTIKDMGKDKNEM